MMIVLGIAGILFGIGCLIYLRWSQKRTWNSIEHMLRFHTDEIKMQTYDLSDTREGKAAHMIRSLYESLAIEHAEADKEKELVKSYVADLSHQLKTPLANVKLYTEILSEEGIENEQSIDFLKRLSLETEKLQWLLDSLTKITRLEIGAIQFEGKMQPIHYTVEMAVSGLEARAREKDITITTDVCEMDIYHNSKWTAEAISNIIENAIKYSDEHSEITITTEKVGLYLQINVTDHGIGIKKSDFNEIFKRFYRGDNVENMQGSGLGLYLAQLIMNQQSGYIIVKSELGKGSTFQIYLPMME